MRLKKSSEPFFKKKMMQNEQKGPKCQLIILTLFLLFGYSIKKHFHSYLQTYPGSMIMSITQTLKRLVMYQNKKIGQIGPHKEGRSFIIDITSGQNTITPKYDDVYAQLFHFVKTYQHMMFEIKCPFAQNSHTYI